MGFFLVIQINVTNTLMLTYFAEEYIWGHISPLLTGLTFFFFF